MKITQEDASLCWKNTSCNNCPQWNSLLTLFMTDFVNSIGQSLKPSSQCVNVAFCFKLDSETSILSHRDMKEDGSCLFVAPFCCNVTLNVFLERCPSKSTVYIITENHQTRNDQMISFKRDEYFFCRYGRIWSLKLATGSFVFLLQIYFLTLFTIPCFLDVCHLQRSASESLEPRTV